MAQLESEPEQQRTSIFIVLLHALKAAVVLYLVVFLVGLFYRPIVAIIDSLLPKHEKSPSDPDHFTEETKEPPPPPLDEKAVKGLVDLSKRGGDVDLSDKLSALRDCSKTLGEAKCDEETKKEIDRAATALVTGNVPATEPAQLPPQGNGNEAPYARMVHKPILRNLPDPEQIFEKLIAGAEHSSHPAGLSSLFVAFGSLISLNKTYPAGSGQNQNASFNAFDLLPLYGLTDEDSKKIRPYPEDRIGGRGLLSPDALFESDGRLAFLTPPVIALLILFNRNHNYIASKLFEINEQEKWVDPATLEEEPELLAKQDDEIFKLAQRLNRIAFRNVVVNDFLKGLLGFEAFEDVTSIDFFSQIQQTELKNQQPTCVEFAVQFGWNSMLASPDIDKVKEALELNFGSVDNVTPRDLTETFEGLDEPDRIQRSCAGLERNASTSAFNDSDIASLLLDAVTTTASKLGLKGTAQELKVFEVDALQKGRDWGICAFNDYRELLGLPAYKSFEDWSGGNQAVADAARELYTDIESLELYVGLRGEKILDGPGFKLGKTLTQGIIADIVQTVRSNPIFSQNCDAKTLTAWGYEEAFGKPSPGACGGVISKLLLRGLPNNFTPEAVQTLFPFYTPPRIQELLRNAGPKVKLEYSFDKPQPQPVQIVKKPEAIKAVMTEELTEDGTIGTGYGESIKEVFGGLRYFLGDDNRKSHDRDELVALHALFPDRGSFKRYAAYYRTLAQRLIREKTSFETGKGRIDLVQDVIYGISARWAAEKLCGIELNKPGGPDDLQFYKVLKTINDAIFGYGEPQERLLNLEKASKNGKLIMNYIQRNLAAANRDYDHETSWVKFVHLVRELLFDQRPVVHSSHDFLCRLTGHADGRNEKELSANVLGLAVLSSVSWAEACSAAVRFYLDDKRAKERDILRELVKGGDENNALILGYIREAQRLDPSYASLHRFVKKDRTYTVGDTTVELKKGEKVVVDLKAAMTSEDSKIDPNRQVKLIYGSGFHRCSGIPFVEATLPEVFRVIFRLEGLTKEASTGKESIVVSFAQQN